LEVHNVQLVYEIDNLRKVLKDRDSEISQIKTEVNVKYEKLEKIVNQMSP